MNWRILELLHDIDMSCFIFNILYDVTIRAPTCLRSCVLNYCYILCYWECLYLVLLGMLYLH